MPEISVVMSVYNGERYLKETIDSILDQTFQDFEFIIVNDGSTDDTLVILEEYEKKDSRIRTTNQENQGLTKSLNKGIKRSRGSYVARIDCGDVALPQRLEKQVSYLENNKEVYGTGTWANIINGNGRIVDELRYPTRYEEIKKVILRYNPFVHPSLMFRRGLFDEIGLYDESFRYAQDYELMLRAVKRFKIVNMPEVLLNYRFPNRCITLMNRRGQEWNALRARFKALMKYGYPKWQHIYLIKPAIFFLTPMGLKNYIMKNYKRKV